MIRPDFGMFYAAALLTGPSTTFILAEYYTPGMCTSVGNNMNSAPLVAPNGNCEQKHTSVLLHQLWAW